MDWFALKHALLSHLPVAAGLLLPWALLAAQRPGRGIRPWWTVARYLGWAGLFGTFCAFVSGLATARFLALIPPHRFLPVPPQGPGPEALLFRHALWGLGSLLVGIGATWAMNRPRKDHESLGFRALLLGLGWCAMLLVVGEGGYRLAHDSLRPPTPVAAALAPPVPKPALDSESTVPVRALDYASLEAIHPEPVKSPAHGGRWIRAWVSPEAAPAYRAGQPLPSGALVVLSSSEDRWGRPSADPGPIHALEMKASGPTLTFYWARVPMDRRPEFGGESRVYWRGQDPHLEACRTCHAEGMADPAQRSRWRAKRVVPDAAD
ncbi:MAG: hypothetical protein IPI84_00705 [Holophagaceae bacterium]|nr:hypothetical protein [Holophagaceae bacterium]